MDVSVEITSVRAAELDGGTFENIPVSLVDSNAVAHHRFCFFGVIQTMTAVRRLYAGEKIVVQHHPIMIEMFAEGFDGCRRAAAVVLGQRNEHPSHGRQFVVGAVVDVLTCQKNLLFSRQRPVDFLISHAAFAVAGEVITVGDVQIHAVFLAPAVEFRNGGELGVLGIFVALVPGMLFGCTGVPRIGTVVFEDIKSGFLEEGADIFEVILSPFAAETGRIAEDDPVGNDVVILVDGTGGEQGIAADLNAAGMGVIGDFFEFCDVFRRSVFHIQTAAERENQHFKADFHALVDALFQFFEISGNDVDENRVFRCPRREGLVQTVGLEHPAVSVVFVKEKEMRGVGGEFLPIRDLFVWTERRLRDEQDRIFGEVIHLRSVVGIGREGERRGLGVFQTGNIENIP